MSISTILRLLKKNLLWLVLFPGVLAGTVVYLTKSMPREYQSAATVYTGLASGYSITSGDGDKVDYFAVNNAFDNLITTIKSRETISEVGKHLLAQHLLLTKPNPLIISAESFKKLNEAIDEPTRKQLVVAGNEPETYRRIDALSNAADNNNIKKLLYNSTTHYAVESISGRVTASRKSNSDMLELAFKADDPGVCQHTLRYLIDSFRSRYTGVKTSETENVVRYFEEQVRKAQQNLLRAEDSLKDFGVKNKVINYGEQSKFVAESKEDMTTEYHHEQMRLQAAKFALDTLEKRLSERSSVLATNKELLSRRTELSDVQNELANAQVYGYPPEKIAQLDSKVASLSEELKVSARRYYNNNSTIESLPQANVLNEWLSKLMESRQSAARLGIIQKRLREYDGIYKEFAPLGSTINRMERQVGVVEKEYLAVLHGLNLARLKQKNVEMAGPLTVLDAPIFPLKPQPSKRVVFVVASFMGGLVLVFAYILGRELLIPSIKSPERFESTTDIAIASALPFVSDKTKGYDLVHIEKCMIEQLRSVILVESERHGGNSQIITLFSPRQEQGRTWVGERISQQFAQLGYSVCYLYPGELSAPPPVTSAKVICYPDGTDLAHVNNVADFVALCDPDPMAKAFDSYDFIFFELPGLLQTAIPARLVRQATLSLLVIKANAVWSKADSTVCRLYEKATTNPIFGVLNAVDPDRMASLLGFQPKSKWFRRSRAVVDQSERDAGSEPEPDAKPTRKPKLKFKSKSPRNESVRE